MMRGLMMDRPLLLSSVIDYAAAIHPKSEVVSVTVEGGQHRYSYVEARKRIIQLAHGLQEMGVKPGDRVATLAWNGYRHFELYFAISAIGAICHTLNPRLSTEQMDYIVNHAGDTVLFADLTFLPQLEQVQGLFPDDLRYVALTDRAHMPAETKLPNLDCYEEILAGKPEEIVWPEFDENTASGLCYTSGTTGNPKGALYSHRSNVLHSLFVISTNIGTFGADKKILPVVPLFHANAWGLPYSAALSGASLVFPGAALDGPSIFNLMDQEEVYSAWGVPTVWLGLLQEMESRGRKPKGFSQTIIGGSAAPGPMIDALEKKYQIDVMHGWGMTEMSPVGTLAILEPDHKALPIDKRLQLKRKQGRPMFGVDLKIVDEDGQVLPHDGEAIGELCVRGSAIVSGYYNDQPASEAAIDDDGWFRTGDVASISPDSFLTLVDRAKDLVKSGGEWISSIDIENDAMGHPGVAEAAVIAIAHPKWDERPLLIVVKAAGADPSKQEILDHIAGNLAKWQVPDEVEFVDELPHTATGKVSKLKLRQQFKEYILPA